MNIEEIIQTKKFGKKQVKYLEENELIIVKKSEMDKFKSMSYEKPIEILSDKICSIFIEQFKSKIRIYCKDDIDSTMKKIKEDVVYFIENFMEVIYDFKPEYKKEWNGKEVKDKATMAIKRYQVWEIINHSRKVPQVVEGTLFLNKLKAKKAVKDLNENLKISKYSLKSRKIV